MIGPGNRQQKEAKILNRVIRFTNEGLEYEADPRHAEIIVNELGLRNCKPVNSPGDSRDT